MPQHYALSELLIILVALWTARVQWRLNLPYSAIGILLFGVAASLGALRFGLSLGDNWVPPHQFASQFGGLVGLMALAHQLLRVSPVTQNLALSHLILAAVASVVRFVIPPARVPLFLLWSLILIYLAARQTPLNPQPALFKAALAAIMLVNLLVLRQASWLSPALSWHAFHVGVALWLLAMHMLVSTGRLRSAPGPVQA